MQKNILFVDDDSDDIEFLKSGCLAVGFEAMLCYEHVRDAFNFLQAAKDDMLPSLIVTDLNMPKEDGYDLLEYVKAEDRLSSIKTAVLSTSFSNTEINMFTAIGVNGIFIKPYEISGYQQLCEEFKKLIHNQ